MVVTPPALIRAALRGSSGVTVRTVPLAISTVALPVVTTTLAVLSLITWPIWLTRRITLIAAVPVRTIVTITILAVASRVIVTLAAAMAATKHLHFIGADLGGVAVLTILVLPLARAQ
jgi:hypothetical protein